MHGENIADRLHNRRFIDDPAETKNLFLKRQCQMLVPALTLGLIIRTSASLLLTGKSGLTSFKNWMISSSFPFTGTSHHPESSFLEDLVEYSEHH